MPSLTDEQQQSAFRQLGRRVDPGATFRRAWPLTGGVSAEVTVIELERPGGERSRVIVRRHGAGDLKQNRHIARDEYALLQLAHDSGLPVPRPILLDESGALFPTPVLVIEYVEGETEFAPADLAGYLARAAASLARIHTLAASPALSFLPIQESGPGPHPAQLDDSLSEGRIRDALDAAGPPSRVNGSVLLHGDYWPGNLLWDDGRLAAVIDWEDAHTGDPLADLGNSRLEFLWAFGPDAMIELTRQYLSRSPIDPGALPYWDLRAALRPCSKLAAWGLDPATEHRMRDQHAWFVAQALAALLPG